MKHPLSVLLLLAASGPLFASECDCSQIIDQCQGAITVMPTGQTKGHYGADLHFNASAAQCAKIDYWVGSKTASTLLTDGKKGKEHIVSPDNAPIDADQVIYRACQVCKTSAQVQDESDKRAAVRAAKQAEIEQMVSDANSNGSLDAYSHYPEPQPPDMIDTVTDLQTKLIRMQNQARSKGN